MKGKVEISVREAGTCTYRPDDISNILCSQFLNFIKNQGGISVLSMQTIQHRIQFRSLEHFVMLIPSESFHVLHTLQI
jgi:hypothetical protein